MTYGRYGAVPYDSERAARMNVFRRMAGAQKGAEVEIERKSIEDYATERQNAQQEAGMWGGGLGGILGYIGTDLATDVALNALLTVGTGGILNPANPMTQLLIKGGKGLLTAGITAGAGTGLGAKLGTDFSRMIGGKGNEGYSGPNLTWLGQDLANVDKNIMDLGNAQSINNMMTGFQVGSLASGGMEKLFGGDAVGKEAAGKIIEDTAAGEVEKVVGDTLVQELANAPKSVVDKVMKLANQGKMIPGVDATTLANQSPDVIKAAVDVGLKDSAVATNVNTMFNKSYGDIFKDMIGNTANRFDMNPATGYQGILQSILGK